MPLRMLLAHAWRHTKSVVCGLRQFYDWSVKYADLYGDRLLSRIGLEAFCEATQPPLRMPHQISRILELSSAALHTVRSDVKPGV